MRSSRDQSLSGIVMEATRIQMLPLFLLVVLACVSAQDTNFGVKVKCYISHGTVVCPGCNSRAGLSCPRNYQKENCITETPYTRGTRSTESYDDEAKLTTVMDTNDIDSMTTTPKSVLFDEIPQEELEYWTKKVRENLQFRLFLYRILMPYKSQRMRRSVKTADDDDTCNWNGDCPCPLICCKTGDGCPKRCKMGIRLPPPWG